jgi:hypothetical protein
MRIALLPSYTERTKLKLTQHKFLSSEAVAEVLHQMASQSIEVGKIQLLSGAGVSAVPMCPLRASRTTKRSRVGNGGTTLE